MAVSIIIKCHQPQEYICNNETVKGGWGGVQITFQPFTFLVTIYIWTRGKNLFLRVIVLT